MRKGFRYLACPCCKKRGVRLAMPGGGTGEDNYQCRYCDWYVYLLSNAPQDKQNLDWLREANPEEAKTL